MRKSGDFPKVVKAGSVAVKIYRLRHATTSSGWVYAVAWVSPTGRKMRQFADEASATEEARLRAAQLASGRIEAAELTRGDRDELVAARALCGRVPLLAALEEWRRARELSHGNVLLAAEAWSARNGRSFEVISIADAVERFLEAKRKSGVDVSASYQKILPTLTAALGERSLHTVSARELTAWMERRHPNPVTRNTARKRIVTLWRWARRQGYLPRDALSEAEQTETAQERTAEIGVIDGKTFAALLDFFRQKHPGYLPPLVIAGFCGLRRSEIHAQSWEDIHLDRKFVRVTSAKRNTPARRLVALSEAAVEWLRLSTNQNGPLCDNMAIDKIREIARAANFALPENCFRHSFISHRVARTGNVAETALEAGNSPQIIFRHYRELFTKEEGENWFGLRPGRRA